MKKIRTPKFLGPKFLFQWLDPLSSPEVLYQMHLKIELFLSLHVRSFFSGVWIGIYFRNQKFSFLFSSLVSKKKILSQEHLGIIQSNTNDTILNHDLRLQLMIRDLGPQVRSLGRVESGESGSGVGNESNRMLGSIPDIVSKKN